MLVIRNKQSGMSLIEAMIALVIISVGLLGIAALQIVALKQNSSSQWHSQAVWYSYEISDRILANDSVFVNYNNIDTINPYEQDCQTASCSALEMVTSDAEDWKRRVETLPAGRGIISLLPNGGLLISVMWDDEGTGVTGTNCTTDEDLTCYSVTILN